MPADAAHRTPPREVADGSAYVIVSMQAERQYAGLRGTDRIAFQHAQGLRLAANAARALMGRPLTDDVHVTNDASGRPRLLVGHRPSDIDVSISHSGAFIVAAAVRGTRIGIDIEPLKEVPPRSWRYFLTGDVVRACNALPHRALWSWTIKEAMYKALARPVPMDFKKMEVRGWDEGLRVVLHDEPASARRPTVHLREHRGHALTVVTL